MNETETRVITSHIPVALAEQIDAVADRLERSRGWVVKQALTDFLALEEQRHHMTLEALADVDSGRVIPHSEMEIWLDSLINHTEA